MTNNEQFVVAVEGESADGSTTYTITTNDVDANGTVTLGGADEPIRFIISESGVTQIDAVPESGINPATLMTIGGIATAVGLLLTIIAASLISKALKAGKGGAGVKSAAPVSFAPQAASGTDPQVIAAITAALMAYQGETGGNGQLVVRSVRRVGSSSGWANAGRQAQINY